MLVVSRKMNILDYPGSNKTPTGYHKNWSTVLTM